MKPIRPFYVAACAALLALVLNGILRVLFKLEGMPATVGIAFGVGGLLALWFSRVPKRVPSPQERTRVLWWYTGLLAVPSLVTIAAGASTRGVNWPGLFIVALHLLAYPAAGQFFLSEKRMNALLPKQT